MASSQSPSSHVAQSQQRLLEGLVNQLGHHQQQHDSNGGGEEGDEARNDDCRVILGRLRSKLPMLTQCLDPTADNVSYVGQVVHVLQLLVHRRVCPHSSAVFDFGGIHQVAPLVRTLTTLLPPPKLAPVHARVVEVLSTLGFMLSAHLIPAFECLFRDLVLALRALHVAKAAFLHARALDSAPAPPTAASAPSTPALASTRLQVLGDFMAMARQSNTAKSSFQRQFFASDLVLLLPDEAHVDTARVNVLRVVAQLLVRQRIQFLRSSPALHDLCTLVFANTRNDAAFSTPSLQLTSVTLAHKLLVRDALPPHHSATLLAALWAALAAPTPRPSSFDDAIALCLRKILGVPTRNTPSIVAVTTPPGDGSRVLTPARSQESLRLLSLCCAPMLDHLSTIVHTSSSPLLKTTITDVCLAASLASPSFATPGLLLLAGCIGDLACHAAATQCLVGAVSREPLLLPRAAADVVAFIRRHDARPGAVGRHAKRRRLSFDGSQHDAGAAPYAVAAATRTPTFVFMTARELVAASASSATAATALRCVAAVLLQALAVDDSIIFPDAGALQPLLPNACSDADLRTLSNCALNVVMPLLALRPSLLAPAPSPVPPPATAPPFSAAAAAPAALPPRPPAPAAAQNPWAHIWARLLSTAVLSVADRVESALRSLQHDSASLPLALFHVSIASLMRLFHYAPPPRVALLQPCTTRLMMHFEALLHVPHAHEPLTATASHVTHLALHRLCLATLDSDSDSSLVESFTSALSIAQKVLLLAACLLQASATTAADLLADVRDAVQDEPRDGPDTHPTVALLLRVVLQGTTSSHPRTRCFAVRMIPVAVESILCRRDVQAAKLAGPLRQALQPALLRVARNEADSRVLQQLGTAVGLLSGLCAARSDADTPSAPVTGATPRRRHAGDGSGAGSGAGSHAGSTRASVKAEDDVDMGRADGDTAATPGEVSEEPLVLRLAPTSVRDGTDLGAAVATSHIDGGASVGTVGTFALWAAFSSLWNEDQHPDVRRAYAQGAFAAVCFDTFADEAASSARGLAAVIARCEDDDFAVAELCASAVAPIAHAVRRRPALLPPLVQALTGSKAPPSPAPPSPSGSWLALRPLVTALCHKMGVSDDVDVEGWDQEVASRYVAALASFAIGLVPRELLQTAATAGDGERQDYDARQLLGEIVVKLVRLWMEAKGTEFGAAVWEALDNIAVTWRHRNPTGSSGVATDCMSELFEALRGQVYPAIIVSLLSGDRPELLTEFLQELLRGEVGEAELLRNILPDVLPVLFLQRRSAELGTLAAILEQSDEANKEDEDDPKPTLRPSASMLSATCGFSDLDRARVVRLVRPKLHFVVGRLLMQQRQATEEQIACWNLLLALFGPSPTQILARCWYELLVWLSVEFGKHAATKRGNPVFAALTMIAKLMKGHRLLGGGASGSQQGGGGHRSGRKDGDKVDAMQVVEMSQQVNSQIEGEHSDDGGDDDDDPLQLLVRTYFLYITNKLNGILNDDKSTQQDCIIVLTSLQRLISILKHRVGQFIPIVMATLQTPLQRCGLALSACRVYMVFVQSLSVETLQANLSTVTVPMLPILSAGTPTGAARSDGGVDVTGAQFSAATVQVANAVVQYITQQRQDSRMKAALAELRLLSTIPELGGPSRDEPAATAASPPGAEGHTRRRIAVLVSITNQYDSFAVKRMGIRQLKAVFVDRRADVRQLVSRGDACAPEIVDALRLMLRLSSSSNEELRNVSAECLGELGAIDPARVASIGEVASTSHAVRIYDAMELCVMLIRQHLVKGLRASHHTMVQDRFAYAIQEMLRVMEAVLDDSNEELQLRLRDLVDCSAVPGVARIHRRHAKDVQAREAGSTTASSKRRRRPFPVALKEKFLEDAVDDLDDDADPAETDKRREEAEADLGIIMPYWSTSYVAHGKQVKLYPPFYDSFRARQKQAQHLDMFDLWLANWTRYLIFCAGGPEWVIYFACRGVLKFDTGVATTLLPYLVQDVLTYRLGDEREPRKRTRNGSERRTTDRQKYGKAACNLRDEILAVLRDQWTATHSTQRRRGHHSPNAMQHKSTQAVFQLLDTLSQWNKPTRDSSRGRGDGRPSFIARGRHGFQWLMSQIPRGLLAEAAARCRAHTRAVLYVENDLRAKCSQGGSVVLRLVPKKSDANKEHVSSLSGIGGVYFQAVPYTRRDLAYLQQVYSNTTEPDGLRGIATLRAALPRPASSGTSLSLRQPASGAGSGSAAPATTEAGNGAFQAALTLREQLIDHEQSANWNEALMCYEQALHSLGMEQRWFNAVQEAGHDERGASIAKEERSLHAGLLRCLLNVGHLETALHRATGLVSTRPELISTVAPLAVEAAWRLGRWSALEELLCTAMNTSASVHVSDRSVWRGVASTAVAPSYRHASTSAPPPAAAKEYELLLGAALLALQSMACDAAAAGYPPVSESEHYPAFQSFINAARRDVVGSLAAASMESYHRAYPLLLRLHTLQELERSAQLVQCSPSRRVAEVASWGWEDRLVVTTPSFRLREPVLALRRCILRIFGMEAQEAEVWLTIATAARSDRHYPTATTALLHASRLGCVAAEIETAEMLHAQGHVERALLMLEPIEVNATSIQGQLPSMSDESKKLLATRVLLTTNWMQESGQKQGDEVIGRYSLVTKLRDKWEKGWFHLAKYFDFLHKTAVKQARARHAKARTAQTGTEETSDEHAVIAAEMKYIANIVQNYGQSLKMGHKYIFQSLPRMLTLWFDFSAKAMRTAEHLGMNTAVANLSHTIMHLCAHLPTYYWMTALPQLVSRISHTHADVVECLSNILKRLLAEYPKQAMWTVVGLTKSRVATRSRRAQAVCKAVSRERPDVAGKVLQVADRLFQDLIEMARLDTKCRAVRLRLRCRRDIEAGEPLLLPLQSALTPSLPDDGLARKNYDAFAPTEQAYIHHFGERAEVIHSKETPKKIEIHAQNGTVHTFLCKAEKRGDLRKDARMMEFNSMVNRLLAADPETRRRKLRLRTYAVVCLNEECGLMEWVEHTTGFRQVVSAVYRAENLRLPIQITKKIRGDFEAIQTRFSSNASARVHYYRSKVLLHFPAVFHKWFLTNFSDPTQWFESRLSFARSAAVWSMVGHIVGLGDRHGENILIDTTSGECVHVDFDCLFDKGLMLSRPEIVPFRLSPNMLDALGVAGYEGVFRHVAEATMSVLRGNRDVLISVLESFVHDPLVEWRKRHHKSSKSKRSADTTDEENENARSMIERINERLVGFYNVHVEERHASGRRHGVKMMPTAGHRKAMETPPLSIRGQVHRLIKEAVSDANASAMYIGWMPFL